MWAIGDGDSGQIQFAKVSLILWARFIPRYFIVSDAVARVFL